MLCSLVVIAAPANAGELMPFEIPEEEVQWDQIELDQFKIDPSIPVAPDETAQKPVDNRPDYPAPNIDAYFDLSLSDADFTNLGYSETPGGYRFIVGFRIEGVGGNTYTFAPEFGYTRIGQTERQVSITDTTDPNFTITTTDTFNSDVSALDFGGRFGLRLTSGFPSAEAYARAGMHFYHVSDKVQRTLVLTPKPGNPAPGSTQVQQPASVSEAKLDLYGALGISLAFGKVPSLYAEYAARRINGEVISVSSVGLLLNF